MANIDTLYPRILINAADAPPDLLLIALRDAGREFFREAQSYRADVTTPIAVSIGTAVYTLTPPADTQLVMPKFIDFQADSDMASSW